ncbi:MAG: triose-phosphate isomerase [Bacillota bacterium]
MLIVANWKAYVETSEKAKRLHAVAKRLAATSMHDIVIAPPAVYLGYLSIGNRTKVQFASQDLSISEGGAATGETTAVQVTSTGASYAIIGHSERRARGETDDTVSAKVERALAEGLTPIVCIGEKERDADARYLAHLRDQIAAVYGSLSPKDRARIVLAYEPIWAIGKTASEAITPVDLTEMILYIRKLLTEHLSGKASTKTRILYGGSVEPGNVRALSTSGIDGFLIGHASTDAASFGALVKAVA